MAGLVLSCCRKCLACRERECPGFVTGMRRHMAAAGIECGELPDMRGRSSVENWRAVAPVLFAQYLIGVAKNLEKIEESAAITAWAPVAIVAALEERWRECCRAGRGCVASDRWSFGTPAGGEDFCTSNGMPRSALEDFKTAFRALSAAGFGFAEDCCPCTSMARADCALLAEALRKIPAVTP